MNENDKIQFLASYDINQYDRPSIAADVAVFSIGRKISKELDYRRLPAKTLRLLLIRRAEQPYQGEWALPGGFMQQGETIQETARRELKEETGFEAGRMVAMGKSYPSPGFMTEVLYTYCALDLVPGESEPDEGEFVEVIRLPIKEVERRIAADEICDGKTIIAMYRARLLGLLDAFD